MTETSTVSDYRLPAHWAPFVMPLLLSICMTFIVSGIATVKAVGLTDDFLGLWMGAWGVSWVIAFPVLLLVLPAVRKLTGLIVRPK